jgi:sialidase-1
MHAPRFLALSIIATNALIAGEPEFSDVFLAGQDGYKSIRIPSVVVTSSGTVLAFAEGRAARADQAANDIILKRSTDGGKTWAATQLVADAGDNSLNNPCAVIERESGRIFVMFQSYPAGLGERSGQLQPGLDGPDIVRNAIVWSDDGGATWSQARDITHTTKRPARVTTIASGPGIGLQLVRGPQAGRLIIPFNEGPYSQWNVYAVFSDDRGASWKIGEPAPGAMVPDGKGGETSLVNEVQMVELSDGAILLNSRRGGGHAVRKTAVSHDGGATWSSVREDEALRDPGCQASIFRFSDIGAGGRSRVLYCGPDSTRRENGTIRLSYDDCETWPVKKVLHPGSFGYSVLTALSDGTIGCLFETDDANRIVFARFTLEWLTDDKDRMKKE